MSTVGPTGRAVARAAQAAFGGTPRVERFYDDSETTTIDILSCLDHPAPGFVSYSTVNLHESPNFLESRDARVEMAGVASAGSTAFANMLATAAFFVIKQGWLCAPGVVFPGLVRQYRLADDLEHILWAPPFAWTDLEEVVVDDDLAVHWLLAIPISDSERRFLEEHGFDRLESLFADNDVEYFDLSREPAV